MKFLKIYFLIAISISLSGCIHSTALIGPGVTIATTGNIMQAGFQYGANTAIKNETGKDVFEHFKDVVEEEQDNKKIEQTIKNIATNTIEKVKKKLLKN
jgi:mannitol-1-phosphate/altronate dehydrogenase